MAKLDLELPDHVNERLKLHALQGCRSTRSLATQIIADYCNVTALKSGPMYDVPITTNKSVEVRDKVGNNSVEVRTVKNEPSPQQPANTPELDDIDTRLENLVFDDEQ
jgi:hypothetical protein